MWVYYVGYYVWRLDLGLMHALSAPPNREASACRSGWCNARLLVRWPGRDLGTTMRSAVSAGGPPLQRAAPGSRSSANRGGRVVDGVSCPLLARLPSRRSWLVSAGWRWLGLCRAWAAG